MPGAVIVGDSGLCGSVLFGSDQFFFFVRIQMLVWSCQIWRWTMFLMNCGAILFAVPPWTPQLVPEVSPRSSVQDGMYAFGKPHMRSTPSLKEFSPNFTLETVPMLGLIDDGGPFSSPQGRSLHERFLFLRLSPTMLFQCACSMS